jgi:hypothetical protein
MIVRDYAGSVIYANAAIKNEVLQFSSILAEALWTTLDFIVDSRPKSKEMLN